MVRNSEDLEIKKKRLRNNNFSVVDIILIVFFTLVGFIFFAHSDIIVTAERSFLLLDGHIADFYSAAEMMTGGGANYFPTTFIIYAIWNIPLKLLGFAPDGLFSSGVLQIMWYKLLPTICYVASMIVVYKIAYKRLKYTQQKAKLIMYCYAAFPIGFFSQFFFYQYDIFTVLFMLLGIYYYFSEAFNKKDKILFCAFFALAVTCKYFAALIFIVLVLLREKRISRILIYGMGGGSLIIAQLAVCLIIDRDAFRDQVLNFSAISYANSVNISIGGYSISIFALFICVLTAWSYFIKVDSFVNLVNYSLYFSCGICFALFGLMPWHPQWLLFGAFFWCLSSCRNIHFKIFMALDTVWGFVFVYYVINRWQYWIDQTLFFNGILKDELANKFVAGSLSIAEIYRSNSSFNTYLYSFIIAVILINFIFKHPKYYASNENIIEINPIRIRFVVGVLAFLIPAFICLPTILNQPDILWQSAESGVGYENVTMKSDLSLYSDDYIIQPVRLEGGTLEKAAIYIYNTDISDASGLRLSLIDNATGRTVAKSEVYGRSKICSEEYAVFNFEPYQLEETNYSFMLERTDDNADEKIILSTCQADEATALERNGMNYSQHRQIIMSVGGENN